MTTEPIQRSIQAADIAPEALAGNTSLSQQQKVGEASRQFEALLIKQILDASQKTVIKSSLSDDSTTSSIYHDMVTTQLADCISRSGGFGLAKTFEQQLSHPTSAPLTETGAKGAPTAWPTLRSGAAYGRSPQPSAQSHGATAAPAASLTHSLK